MGLLKSKKRSVVGLDIESGFVAAAEIGSGERPLLKRAATSPLLPGLFHEGEVLDVEGVAEQLKIFFHDHDLPRRVRLGLASQRVALRVLELPAIESEQELEAAVRFQAQEELPIPPEQAVLDHRILERYSDGETQRMRVLVVGARRDSVERLLAAARNAGLVPDLVDLSAFAMIRALYVPHGGLMDGSASGQELGVTAGDGEETQGAATMYCYLGGVTNLAIAVDTNCVFNRILPNGVESMAATLAERKGLTLDHARQWLYHVGFERDVESIEGEQEIVEEARGVLRNGVSRIADDVRLSLDYYQATLPDARTVDRIVLAGLGIALEGMPGALEAELGLPVEPRSLGQVQVSPGALEGVESAQLTVAVGLALNEVAA
jgi:type IV pilus assembly protein PilM